MSTQLDVPASPEEEAAYGVRFEPGPKERTFEVWAEDDGWCSACHGRDRRIVLLGHRDGRCAGLCAYCLARAADVMRASHQSCDAPKEEP